MARRSVTVRGASLAASDVPSTTSRWNPAASCTGRSSTSPEAQRQPGRARRGGGGPAREGRLERAIALDLGRGQVGFHDQRRGPPGGGRVGGRFRAFLELDVVDPDARRRALDVDAERELAVLLAGRERGRDARPLAARGYGRRANCQPSPPTSETIPGLSEFTQALIV